MSKRKKKRSGASMMMKRYRPRARPGTRPGMIHVPEGALAPTIRISAYDDESYVDYEDCPLEQVAKVRGKHAVTWIDIAGLGDPELIQQVGDMFGIHRLALEDVVHIPQRSKVEHYQELIYLVVQLPRLNHNHDVEQVSFFVGKDFVLSWRERPSSCFDMVRERIESTGKIIRQSGDRLSALCTVGCRHRWVLSSLGAGRCQTRHAG